jgi:hypothetical protein
VIVVEQGASDPAADAPPAALSRPLSRRGFALLGGVGGAVLGAVLGFSAAYTPVPPRTVSLPFLGAVTNTEERMEAMVKALAGAALGCLGGACLGAFGGSCLAAAVHPDRPKAD